MEMITESAYRKDVPGRICSCVNLQLAGAAINQNGMLSIKQLYSNLRRFSDIDISYSEFIETLNNLRDELNISNGEIGHNVNYISIKKTNA